MTEFKFFCPQCGRNIQCGVNYAGEQINCPSCKQLIVVPQPPAGAVPPTAAAKSRTLQFILVLTAGVIVLAGLVIGGWQGYLKIKIHRSPHGLVAAWSGEDKGADSAGGNNMVLTDITFADGKIGKSFSFNGTSSSIKIPASPSLDIGAGEGFTIMAWIKPTDVDGVRPLIQWSDNEMLNLWIGIRPSENGVLRGDITDEAGNHFVVSNPGTLASGIFQHVAFTYDKTSGDGILYLNGIVVAQRKLGSQLLAHTKGDLWISQRSEDVGWAFHRMFSGLMDEIAIYKRALSASEIQAVCTEQNHGGPLTLPTPSTGWFESWMR
jgi:hypothetical protein